MNKLLINLLAGSILILSACQSDDKSIADWLIDNDAYIAQLEQVSETEFVLDNGLIRRVFSINPAGSTIGLDNLMTGESVIRGIKPEAKVMINDIEYEVGGLTGQPNYAYLKREWIDGIKANPDAFQYKSFETGPIKARMDWKRVRHAAPDLEWPPKGIHLVMNYKLPDEMPGLEIKVHYNMYDGLPVFSKWIELINHSKDAIRLNSFVSEILAAVEAESWVESRDVEMPKPNIQVATDYQFGGMVPANVTKHSVFWESDPDYHTQVGYTKQTPCLLELKPGIGPNQLIEPGGQFESFRSWVLVNDSYDKMRNSLALRKMYRIIAPWTTENPLMMHIRYSDDKAIKLALDQCAEVGFEMAIMTFGSGFHIEDHSEENLMKWKKWADYAHEKGVHLGGYSLLSSRRISEEDDVINPETGKRGGVIHGNAPCLGSNWGKEYMDKLYHFYEVTGMDLLEHDGSYPGHICASETHPGHEGLEDSQWNQWKTISDYYKWCRAQGIYLNVPDWFYLSGSNKNGMGYREVNWSLPRAQQVIHTRQNIFDGTWYKTPSMGWMFVPLTEYHGGGAAATIEPLNEHLEHYDQMIAGNLGNGVQACYRGPRLYDTEETKELVIQWVDLYKKYRDIMESDIIHSSSRRADGRDLDWIFHANPDLQVKGFAMVFNPTDSDIQKNLDFDLYFTGLKNKVRISTNGEKDVIHQINRQFLVRIPVNVKASGYIYMTFE